MILWTELAASCSSDKLGFRACMQAGRLRCDISASRTLVFSPVCRQLQFVAGPLSQHRWHSRKGTPVCYAALRCTACICLKMHRRPRPCSLKALLQGYMYASEHTGRVADNIPFNAIKLQSPAADWILLEAVIAPTNMHLYFCPRYHRMVAKYKYISSYL